MYLSITKHVYLFIYIFEYLSIFRSSFTLFSVKLLSYSNFISVLYLYFMCIS